jgi:hypothetical protein
MSLPTAFQPENCPSNRRPTGVPTAFQPPSMGVCSNPPYPPIPPHTPPGGWKPPFRGLGAPSAAPSAALRGAVSRRWRRR